MPAGSRDGDDARRQLGERIALEHAPEARSEHEDRDNRGERQLEPGVEQRVRVPARGARSLRASRNYQRSRSRAESQATSRGRPRCPRARPTAAPRPRGRTRRSRRARRARASEPRDPDEPGDEQRAARDERDVLPRHRERGDRARTLGIVAASRRTARRRCRGRRREDRARARREPRATDAREVPANASATPPSPPRRPTTRHWSTRRTTWLPRRRSQRSLVEAAVRAARLLTTPRPRLRPGRAPARAGAPARSARRSAGSPYRASTPAPERETRPTRRRRDDGASPFGGSDQRLERALVDRVESALPHHQPATASASDRTAIRSPAVQRPRRTTRRRPPARRDRPMEADEVRRGDARADSARAACAPEGGLAARGSRDDQTSELVEARRPDAAHGIELVDRLEAAVRRPGSRGSSAP